MSDELLAIARELKERLGVNVIFVDRDKRPVGVATYEDLYDREETTDEIVGMWRKAKGKATGIAILGNYICKDEVCYPRYRLVIIDVDDPRIFQTKYAEYLPNTGMVWSTGPRCPEDWSKHDIECTTTPDGRDYECVHKTKDGQEHRWRLGEHNEKRGMALLYVVSEECLKSLEKEGNSLPSIIYLEGGAIEVRIRGYELAPPSIHKSGVPYEWVERKWVIAEMPCEVLRKLVSEYINQRTGGGKAGAPRVVEVKVLTDEQIERLIKHALPYYKPGQRDKVLFSVVSFFVTHNVDYDSARKFVERLVEETNDEEARKRFADLDWAYKKATKRQPGTPPRVWGRDTIISTMADVIKTVDNVENENIARTMAIEWLSELYRILGIERLARGLIITESVKGQRSGKNAVMYLVNDPSWGIVHAIKRYPSKTEVRNYVLDQCAREAGCDLRDRECKSMVYQCLQDRLNNEDYMRQARNALTEWGYDVLLSGVYVRRARIVVDTLSGTEYINADIYVKYGDKKKPRRIPFRYATIDEILEHEEIRKRMSTTTTQDTVRRALLAVLRNMSEGKTRHTMVVTGIVYSKKLGKPVPVARGKYARYFRRFLSEEGGDPYMFTTYMRVFNKDDPKQWARAAQALFTNFTFLRKQLGLRTHAVVSYGEANTGKSTMDKIIACTMTGLAEYEERQIMDCSLVHGSSTVMSPARLGRIFQFVTFPVVVDEGGTLVITQMVSDIFKHALTGMIAYEHAVAGSKELVRYPAYAGLLINTNVWKPSSDPGVVSRIVEFDYSKSQRISKEEADQFMKWISDENVRKGLRAFFRAYLMTAVDDWDKVKDFILDPDDTRGAQNYLRYVMQKLGIGEPKFGSEVGEDGYVQSEVLDNVEVFTSKFMELAREPIMDALRVAPCKSESSDSESSGSPLCTMRDMLERAILTETLKSIGVKIVEEVTADGTATFVCFPENFVRAKVGLPSLMSLAEDLCRVANEKAVNVNEKSIKCVDVVHNVLIKGSPEEGKEYVKYTRLNSGGRTLAVCVEKEIFLEIVAGRETIVRRKTAMEEKVGDESSGGGMEDGEGQ